MLKQTPSISLANHIRNFENQLLKLKNLGVTDTNSCEFGIMLMMSVNISRYKEYINKLQDEGQLSDPICTFDYAKQKLLNWEDLIYVHESFWQVSIQEVKTIKRNK